MLPVLTITKSLPQRSICQLQYRCISYIGYSPEKGRLSSGFTDPSTLTEALISKVKNHLAALDNVSILISNAGSKYNIELLQNNTLTIDEQGFLRVNDCLVLTNQAMQVPRWRGSVAS